MDVAASRICHLAFYVSLLLFFYGTLFPFDFDFSLVSWPHHWTTRSFVPYWDFDRGRIQSLPDLVSNILLTMPLGFFGFLWMEEAKTWPRVLKWGLWGMALGCLVEVIQLAIPSRVSSISDLVNNAVGALGGATLAQLLGWRVLEFFEGIREDREKTLAWLLFFVLVAVTLGPFDLTVSVSHVKAGLKSLLLDPWEHQRTIGHEWLQAVDFALFGALAGLLVCRSQGLFGRPRWLEIAGLLALPAVLELAQLFVESHAPSLRDMAMGFLGVSTGMLCSWFWPAIVRPTIGLLLLVFAIVAAGLSPYQFAPWALHSDFQWIPMFEYYTRTTMDALYDAGIGIVHFGVLAAFICVVLHCSRWVSTVMAVALAAGIEVAQLCVIGRSPGITDILVAALGGWLGGTIWSAVKREPLLTADDNISSKDRR